MKELYNEYFHIPKHGKIRDKVMLIRTAITAIIMIVCLAAMSITAYAYFSYNVTSGSNIIKAANFEANVSITITDSDNKAVDITKNGELQSADLAAGTYTVELTKGESTADTGFCIVTIGDNTYHTAQIGEDVARNLTDASVTFTLKVVADTKITILSHWGTSSFYGYKNLDDNLPYIKAEGCEIDLTTAVNSDEKPSNEEQNPTDETTPTEVIHTVAANETLSAIATKYGVSVEQIAAYNGITDKNNIQVGQKLKIPPVDYVVPADTTEQTTTTPETTTTTETTTTETTAPAETTTPPETTVTDPVETTAPAETTTSTEPTETTSTENTEQTQPVTETESTETTGAPTNEASE